MGQPKQLLDRNGIPLVRWVASVALAAGLAPVIVVTGASAVQVAAALEGLPVAIVNNPQWESGQSTSVQAGLRALPAETGAALFLLVDQPQVPDTLLRALVERHAETLSPIVAPMAGGKRANPVLFDRRTFPNLLAIHGDTGGRALFSQYPVAWLEWHEERILLDIDTMEDYQKRLEGK
jgi:molybdenum cofactor cytidylyltransferase